MDHLDDVARFFADDPAALVAASLACPLCLSTRTVARLVIEPEDSAVQCSCAACERAWRVGVDPAQVMRLVLHPPTSDETGLHLLPVRTAHAPWSA